MEDNNNKDTYQEYDDYEYDDYDDYDDYDEELEEIIDESKKVKRSRPVPKKKRRTRLIIIIAVVAIILAALLFYFNDNKLTSKETTQTAAEIDQTSYTGSNIMRVDLNQVSKINIDLDVADVRIQKSTTNPYVEYTHLYKGEEDIYTIDVAYDNGELTLKSNIQGKELNMKNKVQIVRIFLPQDTAIDEIKATVNAGDVKISDLECKNLDLNVKTGHISFENSFFGGSVSNEIGDITLERTELLNTKLATKVGDIVINEGKLGTRSDFSTESGDIIVSSADSIDNYNVKASMEVGNFILGNISYRNIKDGFTKDNNGSKDISLKTRVGDIIFNKGEGAILEEEEYITNESRRRKEEDEEGDTDYIYEDELEEEEEPTYEIDEEVDTDATPADEGNN